MLLVLGLAACDPDRARHIALPVLADPSSAAAPAAAVEPAPLSCAVEELGRAGRRVTAILPEAGGGIWVGTFDRGVVRLGGPAPLVELSGRRLMVNALAQQGETVWAATQGGLVALAGLGAGAVLLAEEGVSALAQAGGVLYAGTGHGVYRLGEDGAVALPVAGPDGEALRVNALAASAHRLWLGTPGGAYSLPLAALAGGSDGGSARGDPSTGSGEPRADASGPSPITAAWHPLVFGTPASSSNVVTALAVLGDGAVAGTDDGGLALIGPRAAVVAVRLADPLSNQVNPGAAAAASGVLAFGTQGGGLLLARSGAGAGAEVARVRGAAGAPGSGRRELEREAISAVAVDDGGWLVGTNDGGVLRVRCPERPLNPG